jgi:maltooligosyltrehalose trehalohydrolase
VTGAWSLERGATVTGAGTRFSVWAPAASRVTVVVDGLGEHDLEARALGVFEREIPGVRAGTDYGFRLDGKEARPDPVSRFQPAGVHGPSRVVDPRAFRWTDGRWTGREMADLIIYELHVGTFSDAGTFDGAIGHLAELRALGITAVELMPVAEFPGARNWGYDGAALYAPHSAYGGPEGLRRLVNAAHELGLAVILDVVYNHVGPEGGHLGGFGPYFTDRYRTPWGQAVNYDGAGSDEVRRFVIDNALYWITEYHVDGLRLDAIHGIYDSSARHVLRELADAVRIQAAGLGRRVVVIGESDLNDPRVLHDGSCGYAFDAQWSDDLHHAIHARLTGERGGYYSDFDGGVPSIAKALRDRFVYDGRYSAYRRRRHGASAAGIPADRFIVCIQNHDQVGNRATGDRLSALVPFGARKLAAALYLLSPYVPMLFMGEEYDEQRPFLYFVSHGDPALVESVRNGRREEFKAFGWGQEVPDPQDEGTFLRSRLDRTRSAAPEGRAMRNLYRALLAVRSSERLLRPGVAAAEVEHGEGAGAGWIRLSLRECQAAGRGAPPEKQYTASPASDHHPSHALVALFNLAPQTHHLHLANGPSAIRLARRLLGTDDAPYVPGGTMLTPDPEPVADPSAPIALPPLSAALYSLELT